MPNFDIQIGAQNTPSADSAAEPTKISERVSHALHGHFDPRGVCEVAGGEVDPVALDEAVGVDRRQPGDGYRRVRHVQDADVAWSLRN